MHTFLSDSVTVRSSDISLFTFTGIVLSFAHRSSFTEWFSASPLFSPSAMTRIESVGEKLRGLLV